MKDLEKKRQNDRFQFISSDLRHILWASLCFPGVFIPWKHTQYFVTTPKIDEKLIMCLSEINLALNGNTENMIALHKAGRYLLFFSLNTLSLQLLFSC